MSFNPQKLAQRLADHFDPPHLEEKRKTPYQKYKDLPFEERYELVVVRRNADSSTYTTFKADDGHTSIGTLTYLEIAEALATFEMEDARFFPDPMVSVARNVAMLAHIDQVDKAGNPYFEHPERVATFVATYIVGYECDEAIQVAYLHDVVEDTPVTLDMLRELGFSEEVVAAVDALTKRKGESTEDYFGRVNRLQLSRIVKSADLRDNSDPARLSLLDEKTRDRLVKKYQKSYELLNDGNM